MPGKAKGQADDNQRQPRREGQGNSDQSRDDQDRPRDHPGRLDNAEHLFKVTVSPVTQATRHLSPRAATRIVVIAPCPRVTVPTCPFVYTAVIKFH